MPDLRRDRHASRDAVRSLLVVTAGASNREHAPAKWLVDRFSFSMTRASRSMAMRERMVVPAGVRPRPRRAEDNAQFASQVMLLGAFLVLEMHEGDT